MPIVYILIMMAQCDIINETTVSDARCTVVAVQLLSNSCGFQLSLCAYWEEEFWNLLNTAHILVFEAHFFTS